MLPFSVTRVSTVRSGFWNTVTRMTSPEPSAYSRASTANAAIGSNSVQRSRKHKEDVENFVMVGTYPGNEARLRQSRPEARRRASKDVYFKPERPLSTALSDAGGAAGTGSAAGAGAADSAAGAVNSPRYSILPFSRRFFSSACRKRGLALVEQELLDHRLGALFVNRHAARCGNLQHQDAVGRERTMPI
jgi:hypothetical protein